MDDSLTRRGFLAALAGGAAAAGTASAQEQTQRVDMTDTLVFDPETVYVPPGGTVIWQNVGQIGHSVTAYEDDIPADAEYFASGGFGDEATARSEYPDGDVGGEDAYRHTFEVEGTYEYFCIPHESVGMVGTVEVTTSPPPQEGFVSILPAQAQRLAIWGVAALVGVLAFTWALLRYGSDYGESDAE